MGETLNILFQKRTDGSVELQARDSWSGQTVTDDFYAPYSSRQLNSLLKKLNNLESDNFELQEIGKRLFQSLCGGKTANGGKACPVRNLLASVISRILRRRGTIALILSFAPGCDELARYPWELLHNGDHFLLASGIFTLTRALLRPEASIGCELPVHPPLRMLYIGSSPCDSKPLEIERSFEALERGLSRLISNGQLLLDRLEPPTFSELVRYLSSHGGASVFNDNETLLPCYIVHFDGHGAYGRLCHEDECETLNDPDAKRCISCGAALTRVHPQTYLCFCDEDGRNKYIDTLTLRELFVSSDVRLAVFSACETATLSQQQARQPGTTPRRVKAEATLATALLLAQVPAVVAMPFSLQDDLTPTFMFHFYEALADGRTLEEALSRARQALLPSHQGWFIPVLYRYVAEGQEAPVPLLVGRDRSDEQEHPLQHLGALSALVGRDRELLDLETLLATASNPTGARSQEGQKLFRLRPGMHHLALIGPAGIGKSALAFEVVRRNRTRFTGGVIGITLQGGKPFNEALAEISQQIHLSGQPSLSPDPSQRARMLLNVLRARANRELPCLLFVDAFEEAPQEDLGLWHRFLCMMPEQIVVLITSRSTPSTNSVPEGGMCRWYEYTVGKMTKNDLMKLFIELAESSGLDQRIHMGDPEQQEILKDICDLLDGYPLGAELIFGTARSIRGRVFAPEAATRSLEEVRDELRGTPLAGIWAVLEVAYLRLSPLARLLLSYLSAFRLPFSREQILALIAPETPASARSTLRLESEAYVASRLVVDATPESLLPIENPVPPELVQQWRAIRDDLVQASFIQFDGHFYTIHPQVRNFALSYLPTEERRRVHRVAATYYSSLSQPSPEEWFAAFEHLEGAGDPEDLQKAVRLAVRASWAVEGRGRHSEIVSMLRRAETHALRQGDKTGEGQILCSLGSTLRRMGHSAEAVACLTRSLALHRERKESVDAGWALYELGSLLREDGQFDRAEQQMAEAQHLFQEGSEEQGEAWVLTTRGEIARGRGRYKEAQELFAVALSRFRQHYIDEGVATVLRDRGTIYEILGCYSEALCDYEEAARMFQALGLRSHMAWVMADQSLIFADQENYQLAEKTNQEALIIFREEQLRRGEAWTLWARGETALKQHRPEARNFFDESLKIFSSIGNRVDMARVTNGQAAVSFSEGDYLVARELYGQALSIAREQGARQIEGRSLRGLGDVARVLRRLTEARQYYQDASTIAKDLDLIPEQCALLKRQGELLLALGRHAEALQHWIEALSLDRRLGHQARQDLEKKITALVRDQHLEVIYAESLQRCSLD